MIRPDAIADAVKAAIEDGFPTPPGGTDPVVSVTDLPDVKPERLAAGELLVFVVMESYEPGTPLTRGKDLQSTSITVEVVERYTGTEPRMPLEWRRLRSEWFHNAAVKKLNDPRAKLAGTDAHAAESDPVEIDREQLIRNVYWASFTVKFAEEV